MKIRVFLADDHAVLREGLKALLEAIDSIEIVGEAGDGREAVQRALELRPDVLLMDIGMPGLNGIEATRLLCEKWPEACIVILSMYSSVEHVHQAFDAGALGYVLKDSAGREVLAALRSVYAGQRYVTASLRAALFGGGRRKGSPLERLSPRERHVLQLVVEGRTSAQIGAIMKLSPKTVDTYRSRLMSKLGVRDVPGLVKLAIQHGLTSPH